VGRLKPIWAVPLLIVGRLFRRLRVWSERVCRRYYRRNVERTAAAGPGRRDDDSATDRLATVDGCARWTAVTEPKHGPLVMRHILVSEKIRLASKNKSSRRRQTSPPVPPHGKSQQNICVVSDSVHSLYYAKTWRHPQNRKYIMSNRTSRGA